MSLIDEPEEDEQVVATEEDPFNVEEHLLFDTEVLETGPTVEVEAEHVVNVEAQKGKDKVIDDIEGDDVDKSTTSSSSSSDEEVKNVEKKVDEVITKNKKLAAENKKVADRERILEMRVKRLEGDNKELLKKIDYDQSEIDILKVKVVELEEEKARRDEQNEYFKLKNKELEAAKAFRDHEFYMLNKVVESMLGTSVEQKFEELQVEELRAERQAKIDEQMKDKGKGIGSSSAVTERSIVPSMVVENPEPISAISGLFEDDTPMDELIGDSDEEDDEEDDNDENVFSASSHGSDNDDDDAQGGIGLKVTEASTEKTVDDLMNDSVNEESGGADRQGESGDAQNVQQAQKLILRLDTYREEGEHFHTYTLEAIKEMTRMVNPDFKFDFEEELNAEFEEELNAFDINQQPEYEYRYVEEADMYDRVEVEDWTEDDESVSEDTSQLPTLLEFFTEENRDEL
ncbi:peptidoglycan DL-endopeptidase CwlO-like [Helianthus annuus]|uniref:peptidoglycan DL-endopeptidase CwlO-like n=1 Tax=Helianthus annuus TaxID=4232 RepID=UPI000B8F5CBC|nr:peptidoglycan DL-endopeptidase CwlO-like [Helianthus annuus]